MNGWMMNKWMHIGCMDVVWMDGWMDEPALRRHLCCCAGSRPLQVFSFSEEEKRGRRPDHGGCECDRREDKKT